MGRFVEIPDGLVIFWSNSVTTPGTGWTEITGVEKYLRVSTGTIGGTGGSPSHTHLFSSTSGQASTSQSYYSKLWNSEMAAWTDGEHSHYLSTHTHGISQTSSAGTLKVRFTTLRMFKRVKGAGAAIYSFPQNAILLWGDSSAPTGWTKIEGNNGYYIVQGTSSLLENVAGTHTHTISGNTATSSGTTKTLFGASGLGSYFNVPTEAHVHALSGTSGVNSELETDYIGFMAIRAGTSQGASASHVYVPCSEATATGWTDRSETYNGRHIKINDAGLTTGASNLTHTHSLTPTLAAGATAERKQGDGYSETFAKSDHVHSASLTSGETTPSVEYYNVRLFSKPLEEIQYGDVAKLRYRRGGQTHSLVSLSNPISSDHIVGWHNDAYIYIPLVATDSAYASYRRIRVGGVTWALEAL